MPKTKDYRKKVAKFLSKRLFKSPTSGADKNKQQQQQPPSPVAGDKQESTSKQGEPASQDKDPQQEKPQQSQQQASPNQKMATNGQKTGTSEVSANAKKLDVIVIGAGLSGKFLLLLFYGLFVLYYFHIIIISDDHQCSSLNG